MLAGAGSCYFPGPQGTRREHSVVEPVAVTSGRRGFLTGTGGDEAPGRNLVTQQEKRGTDTSTLSCPTLESPAWSLTGHIQLEAEEQRGPQTMQPWGPASQGQGRAKTVQNKSEWRKPRNVQHILF